MAQEEAKFTVIKKDGNYEIREYAPRVVAQTFIDGSFTDAGNRVFNRLFGYISGENSGSKKIAMTAPVTQETSPAGSGEKIAMTAPVTQQEKDGKYRVTFILPASYTMDNAPSPTNSDVTLAAEPETRVAAVTYSGTWSEENYDKYLKELQGWMTSNSLKAESGPIWARYNQPFSLPLLRRNEIIIPIKDADDQTSGSQALN